MAEHLTTVAYRRPLCYLLVGVGGKMAEHLTTVALLVVAALQLTVVEGSQPLLVLEFTAD